MLCLTFSCLLSNVCKRRQRDCQTTATTATPTPLHHSHSPSAPPPSEGLRVSPEAIAAGRTVHLPRQGLAGCVLQTSSGRLWPLYKPKQGRTPQRRRFSPARPDISPLWSQICQPLLQCSRFTVRMDTRRFSPGDLLTGASGRTGRGPGVLTPVLSPCSEVVWTPGPYLAAGELGGIPPTSILCCLLWP